VTVQLLFDVREPERHYVRVEQVFPATADAARTFRMAAWVPGSYKILDFGRNVQDVEAVVGGKQGRVTQVAKDAWTVAATAGKRVTLRFRAYCRELTDDKSHVSADHAHLMPATVAMYDAASRPQPHRVIVRSPRGWALWTGLETAALDGRLAVATDFDHLIDCPIEVGPPDDYFLDEFVVRGRPHRIVLWRPPTGMDEGRIRRDVRRIVATTCRLFGGAPYDHFTFIGHVAVEHGGGLEHRNSTVLGIDPLHLVWDEKVKQNFLPLVAHEFFHTWNIKRILPAAFQPYDLQAEQYTGLLWLFEGFTTYYEIVVLARAKCLDAKETGKLAAEMLKYYEMALGRRHRSVSDCSRLAWTLLYQPYEQNINRNVSYYTKGMFIALCLDAELRKRRVMRGLDAVMRHLWKQHGHGTGLDEGGFAAAVRDATGVDVAAKLRAWTDGTSELPIDAAFRALGWTVKREHTDDKRPLGLGVHFKSGQATIERIPEDSRAAGILHPGDEVVAVDGYKWQADRFSEWANAPRSAEGRGADGSGDGGPVEVTVFRDGMLRTFAVPLVTLPKDKITIDVRKGDATATRRRHAWSNGAV
jgi:predicted metalloprotease with PDZ domain